MFLENELVLVRPVLTYEHCNDQNGFAGGGGGGAGFGAGTFAFFIFLCSAKLSY